MTDIGARLKMARERVPELSARELSLLADASHGTVAHIENGVIVDPKTDLVVRLADALGVSIEWLADGRGELPPAEAMKAAVERARAAKAA